MARVELSDTWTTTKFPAELRPKLEWFLDSKSMKFEAGDESVYTATQGSQVATRLIGGWFVNATKLPKKATVTLAASPLGTQVHVLLEETLGFGLLDPKFKKKYEEYFKSLMDELKTALS